MELQASDEVLPLGNKTRRKASNSILLIALVFVLTVIPLYFLPPLNGPSRYLKIFDSIYSHGRRSNVSTAKCKKYCDLFTGEWVPNLEGPYYTNATCDIIYEYQNCLKHGRPDREFLKWRWKPDGCELPIFEPHEFLKLVRGKALAFVGDSVARNHMQSLICLLSRVVRPTETADPRYGYRHYHYADYNFNVSLFFSRFLVRDEIVDPDDIRRPINLFLDEFDTSWTSKLGSFDYVVISAGSWFFHPAYFYLNRTLAGCLFCPESKVTHQATALFSYRLALRTAFRALAGGGSLFRGVAFLRTFSPSHFEGGAWNNGGYCLRTRPYKRVEAAGLEEYMKEMYEVQIEEAAGIAGKLRLFDATKVMLLRPDGHPGKYGRWAVANRTFANDCVHWCLPGPIDAWNDILQELLTRESGKL